MAALAHRDALERAIEQVRLRKEEYLLSLSKTAVWRQHEVESARLGMMQSAHGSDTRPSVASGSDAGTVDAAGSEAGTLEELVDGMQDIVSDLIEAFQGTQGSMQDVRPLCVELLEKYSLAVEKTAGVWADSVRSSEDYSSEEQSSGGSWTETDAEERA